MNGIRQKITEFSQNQRFFWARFLIFLTTLFLIILRDPIFFSRPRFFAEEGSVFFQYAYTNPWYQSIFYPSQGYIGLPASLATTLAAKAFPIEVAPLITTLTALIVQLIPLGILLWGKSVYWNSWIRKLAGAGIILFAPFSHEIWLNTINSQFYLVVTTFLILIEPAPKTLFMKWSLRIILILSGLTGFISCALLPLYIYKAYAEKEGERRVQVFILFGSMIVQVITALSFPGGGSISSRLGTGLGIDTLIGTILTRSLAPLTIGMDLSSHLANLMVPSPDTNSLGMWPAVLISIVDLLVLLWISKRLPVKDRVLFLGAYLILISISNLFAVGSKPKTYLIFPGYSPRYFFASNVILMLMLLASFTSEKLSRKNIPQMILGGFLIWSLLLGSYNYFTIVTASPNWPVWAEEVAKWKNDPKYELQIWPPGWKVDLTKTGQQ